MKFFLLFLLTAAMAFGAEEPTVEVYAITKYDSKASWSDMPEVIVEIANPTNKTFYVLGMSIESPYHDVEALRGKRWLLIPNHWCARGSAKRPFKPGAKMLVTVSFPWEETSARFRFYFFTSADDKAKVVTVRSRGIERKELGDLTGTTGELTSDAKLEESVSDEEINKNGLPPDVPKGALDK